MKGSRSQEQCAFCQQPLQLIAGFCAVCQAPAMVASHRKLVANTPHRPQTRVLPMAEFARSAPMLAVRPQPRWLRPILTLGIISLVLMVVFIGTHLNGNGTTVPSGSVELSASTISNGQASTTFTIGQSYFLTYSVPTGTTGVHVQLVITPGKGAKRVLTEFWPMNAPPRTFPLVALVPGIWHIALLANDQQIQSLDLTIIAKSIS